MERKPQVPRYPTVKNYNANYISAPKIDNNDIDTTISIFTTGEHSEIMGIIESNKILNFRNLDGETLAHAILKNPSSSLNESTKLEILRLLVHKNVSINAMNIYNQTPLHLAAQKGYYDIIEYLVTLKSDFNKIDNYGNAPVHYLIDNFVSDCKEDEYFKISNKKISKTLKDDNYDKITENYLVLSLIEIINDDKIKSKLGLWFNKIKDMVKKYKFYKILDVQKLINDKNLEIDNVYKKHSSVPVEQEIKIIYNNMVKEINDNIYKDFKIDNKKTKDGEYEFLNNNTLNKIKEDVYKNTKICDESYVKKIGEFEVKIKELEVAVEQVYNTIFILHRLFTYIFYTKMSTNIDDINDNFNEFVNLFFYKNISDSEKPKIYDFDNEMEAKGIFNEDSIINDERMKFIRTSHFEPIVYPPRQSIKEIKTEPLTIDTYDRMIPFDVIPHPTNNNFHYIQIITAYMIFKIKNGTTDTYIYKLNVLFNSIIYIKEYIKIIKMMITNFIDKIETYQFFYLNYINEVIINISNNLVNFKNHYEDIQVNELINNFNVQFEILRNTPKTRRGQHNEIRSDALDILSMLISQIVDIPTKSVYNVDPRDKTNDISLLNTIMDANFEDIKTKLYENLIQRNVFKNLDNIYKKLLEVNVANNNFISNVNINYSLKYLKSFIELVEKDPSSIKLDDFVFNKFYTNSAQFPENLFSYKNKFFRDDKFNLDYAKEAKKFLLKKYFDYDYNEIYKTNNLVEYDFIKLKMQEITITSGRKIFFLEPIIEQYNIPTDSNTFKTGVNIIFYDNTKLDNITEKSYISTDDLFKSKITDEKTMAFIKKTEFKLKYSKLPLVSLENVKELMQLVSYKIINTLTKTDFNEIINFTITKLDKSSIPQKTLDTIKKTLVYLMTNEELLKKVVIEKFIIFFNSFLKIQINQEINFLLQDIIKKHSLVFPNFTLGRRNLFDNISKLYEKKLKKYTIDTLIPHVLATNPSGSLSSIKFALLELNASNYIKTGEKKILLNKCVLYNKVDLLKEKLLHKINLRTLDRNGNTIVNRLIDQYNDYAIDKVLDLDRELYTYKNNRGQDSIQYLFDVLKSINKPYKWEQIESRIKNYELELQMWIKQDGTFGDIELDESKKMIYNIILNSIYLFNESMWLILLKSPNGWNYEDKVKLKEIIKNNLKYEINENLLIKSLTDEDKNYLKNNTQIVSLNKKIEELVNTLEKEIAYLENANKQLEQEKRDIKLGTVADLDALINKNNAIIFEKKTEIANLKGAAVTTIDITSELDKIFTAINTSKIIKDINIDWETFDKLIIENIWSNYLNIINICNNKNNNHSYKYISYYNYSLLNIDYNNLKEDEIKVLINYYGNVVNDVYSDFYDLEKYEDSEFNYINNTMLNILYINVVNVIGIEMYSGILGYIADKYSKDKNINQIISDYKKTKTMKLFELIKNLLKNIIWEKLNMKNPSYPKNYIDLNTMYYEIKTSINTIFVLVESDDDNQFIDKIIKFYKGLVENISYNIYNELVNLLNDMKKNSLLFNIFNILKNKK